VCSSVQGGRATLRPIQVERAQEDLATRAKAGGDKK